MRWVDWEFARHIWTAKLAGRGDELNRGGGVECRDGDTWQQLQKLPEAVEEWTGCHQQGPRPHPGGLNQLKSGVPEVRVRSRADGYGRLYFRVSRGDKPDKFSVNKCREHVLDQRSRGCC